LVSGLAGGFEAIDTAGETHTWCWFCSLGDLIFSSFSARVAMMSLDDEVKKI
jgi:hypothetical protein